MKTPSLAVSAFFFTVYKVTRHQTRFSCHECENLLCASLATRHQKTLFLLWIWSLTLYSVTLHRTCYCCGKSVWKFIVYGVTQNQHTSLVVYTDVYLLRESHSVIMISTPNVCGFDAAHAKYHFVILCEAKPPEWLVTTHGAVEIAIYCYYHIWELAIHQSMPSPIWQTI